MALLAAAPLAAQMPENWDRNQALGAETEAKAWWGGGIWSADKNGPPAPFVDSLGFGNGLVGSGIHLEGGFEAGHWDVAAEVIGYREPSDTVGGGEKRLSLYRSHILHRSKHGWVAGLEQEPLNWGYGLQGGHTLGESGRPFPRFRVESPRAKFEFLGVPLGAWKGQFFLGRLLGDRPLGEEVQDPSYRSRRIAAVGDPKQPYISGFRLDSVFGEDIEVYMNYINLFGGTLNGKNLLEGYRFKDYATAFLGFKDALAEGNTDLNDPNHPPTTYKNLARSASNSDVGFRVRIEPLQKLLRADDVRFYVSRGSKAVNIQFGLFVHKPLYYWWQDTRKDLQKLGGGALASTWDQRTRYTAPSPDVPNDTVGLLMSWSKLRVGVEYLDTVNPTNQDGRDLETGHRSFEHSLYLKGFYYGGDPLGEALAGEARAWTVNLQWALGPRLSAKSWIVWGQRPFRDVPDLWILDHPGAMAVANKFGGAQQTVDWRFSANGTLRLGASAQHQSAVQNVKGDASTGFRWFADLGFTWPGRAPKAPAPGR